MSTTPTTKSNLKSRIARLGAAAAVATITSGLAGTAAEATAMPAVSVGADSSTGACGQWVDFSSGVFTITNICGWTGTSVNGVAPAQSGSTVYVGHTVCDSNGCNGYGSIDFNAASNAVTVDPLLRTATVQDTVGRCDVNVSFSATGTPKLGSQLYQGQDPASAASIQVSASAGLFAPSTGSGTACGAPLSASSLWGSDTFRSIGGSAWATVTGSPVSTTESRNW